jgi:hypothetical protein
VRGLWPVDPLAPAGAVLDPAAFQHLLGRVAVELRLAL